MYYFYFLPSCKNLPQANDGKHHPTLLPEEYSSFQVQVEDSTHVSQIQYK